MDRTPIFQRLPRIWKALDTQGILERYLGVWDQEFWAEQQKIVNLMQTRNISETPDKFLVLLTTFLDHLWKDFRSYQWNRARASESISKYSYNGTMNAVMDLVKDYGGDYCEVVDMASTLAVWSRQGTFPNSDCFFYDPDYFHMGVYQLWLNQISDLPDFLADLEYWKPAGSKWIIGYILNNGNAVFDINPSDTIEVHLDLDGGIEAQFFNQDVWDNFPTLPTDIETVATNWVSCDGALQEPIFNQDGWNYSPVISTSLEIIPTVWVGNITRDPEIFNYIPWDRDIVFPATVQGGVDIPIVPPSSTFTDYSTFLPGGLPPVMDTVEIGSFIQPDLTLNSAFWDREAVFPVTIEIQ